MGILFWISLGLFAVFMLLIIVHDQVEESLRPPVPPYPPPPTTGTPKLRLKPELLPKRSPYFDDWS